MQMSDARFPDGAVPNGSGDANPENWPSLAQTLRLIRADLAFRREFDAQPPGWRREFALAMNPAVRCVISYRLQCFFQSHRLSLFGRIFKGLNLVLYGVEIDEQARIAGGFVIGHPTAIRIAGETTIGKRCIVYHHTMIGPSPYCEVGREPGPLDIGDDVIVGMGASVYGPISIGDGCRIGANSVVEKSCPAGSILHGAPARTTAKTA
jgi:serine O-acetyltransferase